jgi:hypothetical protein
MSRSPWESIPQETHEYLSAKPIDKPISTALEHIDVLRSAMPINGFAGIEEQIFDNKEGTYSAHHAFPEYRMEPTILLPTMEMV